MSMKEEVIILHVFVSHHIHVYGRLRKVGSIQHSRHFKCFSFHTRMILCSDKVRNMKIQHKVIKVFIILLFLFFNKKYASKLKKSDGSCGGLMHTTNMLRINQHHYSYSWKSLRGDEIHLYFHIII